MEQEEQSTSGEQNAVQQNSEANVQASQPQENIYMRSASINEEENVFKTSSLPQQPELTKYLKEKLAIPYNKYCIDCKKNLTTHALIWLGTFVCETCAQNHLSLFGGNQYSYIKNIMKDQWDDYQIRSITIGGNKPFFQLLKEYGIENEPPNVKYKHACVIWYKRVHVYKLDGFKVEIPKPPKDWDERKNMLIDEIKDAGQIVGKGLYIFGGKVKETTSSASVVIANKSSIVKQKIIEKQIGTKIMSYFSSKKKQQDANEPLNVESEQNVYEEQKEEEKQSEDQQQTNQ